MRRFRRLIFLGLFIIALPLAAEAVAGASEGNAVEQLIGDPHFEEEEESQEIEGILQRLEYRAKEEPFLLAASIIFFLAICHTFMAARIMKKAHQLEHEHERRIQHEGRTAEHKPHKEAVSDVSYKAEALHFFGEVEAIFGIWVIPLFVVITVLFGWHDLTNYVGSINFAEPIFVVVIMTMAATRPVLRLAENTLRQAARLGKLSPKAWWLSIMIIAPILGSFITEPAAMTIAALLLAKKFYELRPSMTFMYGTLGLLFVNISVGGTLTHFAAPPVLMVAADWNWTTPFMITHFGIKAVIGILIATTLYYFMFRKEFDKLGDPNDEKEDDPEQIHWHDRGDPIPVWITLVHMLFLAFAVLTSHYPALCVGAFLFFLAFTIATFHHQNPVRLRPALLVGFFLAALKVHGELQGWWISPILKSLSEVPLMVGSTVLTAFNDNAAITYLATQVEGLSGEMKYAVVAGAVTGGGLTVIANAPNPAGQTLLQKYFPNGVSPLKLALSALAPTIIMGLCFMLIPHMGGEIPEGNEGGDQQEQQEEALADPAANEE